MTTRDYIAQKAGCTVEELGEKVFGWLCRIVWNTEAYNEQLSHIWKLTHPNEELPALWENKPDDELIVWGWGCGSVLIEDLGYQFIDVIDKIIPLEKVDRNLYNKDSLASLHDVIFEANGKDIEDSSELRKTFLSLPEEIQAVAKEWGMSDTVFKDKAYEWLKCKQQDTEGRQEPL